jgi:hypothetical protein
MCQSGYTYRSHKIKKFKCMEQVMNKQHRRIMFYVTSSMDYIEIK